MRRLLLLLACFLANPALADRLVFTSDLRIGRGYVGPVTFSVLDATGAARDVSAATGVLSVYEKAPLGGGATLLFEKTLGPSGSPGVLYGSLTGTDTALPGSYYCEASVTDSGVVDIWHGLCVIEGRLIGAQPTTSLSLDVSGNKVTATGSTIQRTLADHFADTVNAKDYVACDGVTDDAPGLALAQIVAGSTKGIVVPCRARIASAVGTISNVRFEGGGALDLRTGGSVTLSGELVAGLHQIFYDNGGGVPTFSGAKVTEVVPQWWGAKGDGSTDDTTAIQAAISAAEAGGGGTVFFSAGTYRIDGQITFATTGTPPVQKSLRLLGVGAHASGVSPPATAVPNGGSILDMRYSGTYGKILSVGHGLLEIAGLTFTDGSGGTLPWIYTTSTTLWVHNSAFSGSKSGSACDQDAIILGGTTTNYGTTDPTDAFQGYGTVIRDNYFNRIRRAVHCRMYCNSIVFDSNTVWRSSGTNLADGAPIELDGSTGAVISNNLVEGDGGYAYAVKVVSGARGLISGNSFWDASGVAVVYLAAGAGGFTIIPAEATSLPVVVDSTGNENAVFGPQSGVGRFGQSAPAATGNVLRLYSGSTADHAFMEWFPRSANRSLRGAYLGYSGAASNRFDLYSQLGNIWIDTASGYAIEARRPLLVNQQGSTSPATGTVTLDANTYSHWVFNLGTTSGTWNMRLTGGFAGQVVTVTTRNTSAGTITTTWATDATAVRMSAWTNPASGNGRSITFIRHSTEWIEISRTTVDVPN